MAGEHEPTYQVAEVLAKIITRVMGEGGLANEPEYHLSGDGRATQQSRNRGILFDGNSWEHLPEAQEPPDPQST